MKHPFITHIFLFFNKRLACLIFVPFPTAENLGFTSYPPAYLNLKAKGNNLLNGANFASAASGYYDPTAKLYVNISLEV